jgi:hypothetical protein
VRKFFPETANLAIDEDSLLHAKYVYDNLSTIEWTAKKSLRKLKYGTELLPPVWGIEGGI